jgi:hypothetical protein
MTTAVRWIWALILAWVACCGMAVAAFALPQGRGYEMVSPVYKAGYGVKGIKAVAPDGEAVAFASQGGFGGVLSSGNLGTYSYLARREENGWSTTALQPPPTGVVGDFSAALDLSLSNMALGPNMGRQELSATEDEFLLHDNQVANTAASWSVFGGMVLKRTDGGPLAAVGLGASTDLCHVVVGSTGGPLLAEASKTNGQIYDLSRGCGGGTPWLRLIGVKNKDGAHHEPEVFNRNCPVELGVGPSSFLTSSQQSTYNAIADGGKELFFTANGQKSTISCSTAFQLFVRLDASRTLEVSRPLDTTQQFGGCVGEVGEAPGEVPCKGAQERPSAYFEGANELGTRVFFRTAAPLTSEDKDEKTDLYMATIGCPAGKPACQASEREILDLVQVSHDPTGEADLQGVTRIAPDGSHVYFVARGALVSGPNTQGAEPVVGADNLYLYELDEKYPAGHIAFIADLCSGPDASGVAEDTRCSSDLTEGARNDTSLWGSVPEAQSSGQAGEMLVFSTYAQLTEQDTDNAKDVYRYDASTGTLERVSRGEAGHDADGNRNDEESASADATIAPGHMGTQGDAHVTEQQEMATRAVSADGSRIVFTTAEPLSVGASNGLLNVYEWHEGDVSLVSTGSAGESDSEATISPAGLDVFFMTVQGLVPQDIEPDVDIYDARMEGGFPLPPEPRQPCSGDGCQGPLTNPAPMLVPGSVSQTPGEDFVPFKKPTRAQQLSRALKLCAKQPKRKRAQCKRLARRKYAAAATLSGRGTR